MSVAHIMRRDQMLRETDVIRLTLCRLAAFAFARFARFAQAVVEENKEFSLYACRSSPCKTGKASQGQERFGVSHE